MTAFIQLCRSHFQATNPGPNRLLDAYLECLLANTSKGTMRYLSALAPLLTRAQLLKALKAMLPSCAKAEHTVPLLAQMCNHLCSNLDDSTRDFVREHWEELLELGQSAAIELITACAEVELPPGILLGNENWVSHFDTSNNCSWTAKAAILVKSKSSESSGVSRLYRLLAVAIYMDPATTKAFEEELTNDFAFSEIVPALLAYLEVQLAKKANTTVDLNYALPAVEAFLDSSNPTLRRYSSQILLRLSSISPTAAAQIISYLSEKAPAVCSNSPVLFDHLSIGTLQQFFKIHKSAESFGILEGFVNESLRWLVRRFAEDAENTTQIISFIPHLLEYLDENTGKWLLKPHLVEPVLMAGIQNRLTDAIVLPFLSSLVRESKLQSVSYTRLLQGLLADSRLRLVMMSKTSLRTAAASLLVAFYRHSPILLGQLNGLSMLLGWYTGTLSEADQSLLSIFRLAELRGQVSFRQVAKAWVPPQLRGVTTSSWQVLAELPPQSLYNASVHVLQPILSQTSKLDLLENSDETFDPLFFLPFLAYLLDSEDISRSSWMTMVSSNALGLAVCALASPLKQYQLSGDRVLAKARNALQASADFRERDEISYILDHIRNTILPSTSLEESLPPLLALFLAQSIGCLGRPEDFTYPLIWRSFLSRPLIDTTDIPLFYNLFYSSSDESRKERLWLLKFLTHGTHTSKDWRIIRRRQAIELSMSLWNSGAIEQDPETRLAILKVLSHHESSDLPY